LLAASSSLVCFSDSNSISLLQVELSKAVGKERIFVLNDLALEYSELSFKKALLASEKAIRLSKKQNDKVLEACSRLNLGNVYYEHCKYDNALEEFKRSFHLYKNYAPTNYVDINYCLNNIAVVYEQIGDYTNALACYLESLKIADKLNDADGKATAYVNLGSFYDSIGLYDKALYYLTNALQIFKHENSISGIATTLGNLSSTHLNLGNYSKALEYQLESLKLEEKNENRGGMAISYSSIADIYLETTNYTKAINNYNESIKLAKKIDNKNILCGAYSGLGDVYFQLKSYKKALQHHNKALNIALEINSKENLFNLHKNLSETYCLLGNHEKAIEHLKKYDEAKDKVFNEMLAKQMLKMENKYRYEKQKHENDLLKSRSQLQELRIQRFGMLLFLSFTIIIILVIALSLLLYTIRKRKLAEKEKQKLEKRLERSRKMETIGLLAGGVAHDLNNVLSGIVSYPDLLLMELPENSPLRQPLLTIKQAGERAAAIVQDLLTLARRGVNTSKTICLNNIVNEVIKSPECQAVNSFYSKINIVTNLSEHLNNINGSEIHLKKMLINLITNSVEANSDTIKISTYNFDHKEIGNAVCLSVSDNGVGISDKDLRNIFEPFYTKKAMGRSGTGLGMAIVWNTVHDHNGQIEIESKESKGTTVKIFFPITNKKIAEQNNKLPLDEYKGNNEKILVVDDIEEQRKIAEKILKKLGYSVATAATGSEAISYIKKTPVDLLILDMILDNGMNGLETYKEILKINPKQKAVIASGYSENIDVKLAQVLGAGAYIKKPYSIESIGFAIKKELSK